MSTVTDYTAKATANTLCGAPISRYRLTYWMLDILKNFFSTPINIPDERLRSLLFVQNGPNPDNCAALFDIAVPYSPDKRKAGTTPAILVSTAETKYPINTVNMLGADYGVAIGSVGAYSDGVMRTIGLNIAIITESCAGTQLLADIIEDFIISHKHELVQESFLSSLVMNGGSAVQEIKAGSGGNGNDLYQIVLSLTAVGGFSWFRDTQGPVYRGTGISTSHN